MVDLLKKLKKKEYKNLAEIAKYCAHFALVNTKAPNLAK